MCSILQMLYHWFQCVSMKTIAFEFEQQIVILPSPGFSANQILLCSKQDLISKFCKIFSETNVIALGMRNVF